MKTNRATSLAGATLLAVASFLAAPAAGRDAPPAGDAAPGVQRNVPPSTEEGERETTQDPAQARTKPYEPATGLDHGSVGGTADHAAPSASERAGDPSAHDTED